MHATKVIVTGGSRGIGLATAVALRKAGARVVSLDTHPPEDAALVDGYVECDVTDEASVVAAIGRAVDTLGGVDAAVLSAGVVRMTPVIGGTMADWDFVMDVNLRGVYLCMREAATRMQAQGGPGVIIAIGSTAGILADRTAGAYAASKAGLHHLVEVAARELGPAGIRVCAVAPGPTATPMLEGAAQIPGYLERVAARTPLGRIAEPEDIAETISQLIGMDWVTGQTIIADGGLHLASPQDAGG